MKKIVCELCEGTVFDKVDGRFVCKGCGTSYSAEEARGMMQEVEGDEPAATGAPAMPQGNPNQQQLDNILMLATNAYSASNNSETENYCNRAIELDATCYKAWMLKGKAIGWSSTIQNPRIAEAAHSFKQAVDFAPDDEKENLKEEAVDELKRLGLACISLRADRFSKYPDKEELNGFVSDIEPLINGLVVLLGGSGDVSKADALMGLLSGLGNIASIKFIGVKSKAKAAGVPAEFFTQIANMMANAAVAGFNKASREYNSDNHPLQNDLKKSMGEIDNCIDLIEMAIDASDDDDDADIKRYNDKIKMIEYVIGMSAYDSYSSSWKSISLTDEAKKNRREAIQKAKDKIKEIEKAAREKEAEEAKKAEEEKQARIAAYWEAHADEKAALDSELKELNDKKAALEKEISDIESQIKAAEPTGKVPSEVEKDKIKDQISDLNNRRAKLGIFAGKEKKQIGEEIASLEGRSSALEGKIEEEKKARKAEADQKCAPLKAKKDELTGQKDAAVKRITAINKELTKDPEE